MAKTKVSEWDSTPGNNTDIDSINIAEGCAPSGINNAIRELMSQVKDFQQGTYSDPFNGPVNGTIGATTPAAGAFTTLTASSTATLNTLASSGATLTGGSINNMAIGGSTAAAGAFTTLAASGAVTLSGGTANGVAYLNGSKVLTTGSALTFDGTSLGVSTGSTTGLMGVVSVNGYSSNTDQFKYLMNWSGAGVWGIGVTASSSGGMIFGQASSIAGGVSSELMRLTSTGLGIGTSSPSQLLHVQRASYGVTALFQTQDGTGNPRLAVYGSSSGTTIQNTWSSGASNLIFANGGAVGSGTEVARFDSSGNLGLGVTPSAWNSGYKGIDITTYGAIYSRTATNSLEILTNAYRNSASNYIYKNNGTAQYIEAANGAYAFYIAPSGTAGNAISFTQAMTLDASGNWLLGSTSSPGTIWSGDRTFAYVKGSATNRSGEVIVESNNGNQQASFFASGGSAEFGLWSTKASAILFGNNNAERARIDSGGNFRVRNPTGSATSTGLLVEEDGANTTRVSIGGANSSSATGLSIYSTGAGAFRFFVSYSGQINATSTSITAISDATLKENVRDLETGLSEVMALRPRRFDWKEETQIGEKDVAGFIAQEVEQVLPELVYDYQYNADTVKKSVKMGDILPTLVKAIQELKAEFDAYKATHP